MQHIADAPFWVWWLVPVLSTAVICGVVALARRIRVTAARRPANPDDSVEDYARFRAAMAKTRAPR